MVGMSEAMAREQTFEDGRVAKALENSDLMYRLLRIGACAGPLEVHLESALDELLKVSWLSLLPKGGIFLTDETGCGLRLVASRNLHEELLTLCARVPFGHCLCGRAAQEGRTQHARCIDERHETHFDGMAPHGHYNVPILAAGEVIGVLVVYLTHGHERDEDEVSFLESFADALGLLIQLKQREEDHLATQQRLRIALNEDRNLMGAIEDHAICSQATPDGVISKVSSSFCDVSGYGPDELVGSRCSIVNSGVHPPEFWRDFWATISSGKAWRGEVCNRSRCGELYWVDNIVIPLFDAAGTIERYVSISFDVTGRKSAEQRLLEKEKERKRVFDRLEAVTELGGIGCWEVEIATKKLIWDETTRKIHEVGPDFVPDVESAIDFYAPEARDTVTKVVEAGMATGEPWNVELPLITARGRRIWVRAVGRAVIENGEPTKMIGSFEDVTERLETQQRLSTALNDLQGLLNVIQEHTIFSQSNTDGSIVDVNQAFCDVSGYTRAELVGTKHGIVKSRMFSPENWEAFCDALSSGRAWRGEVCNRAKDGGQYWTDSIIAPLAGADGETERYISICFDISERKKAETTVSRLGRILDNSSNEIYVFDTETLKFGQVNRGAQLNIGYTPEELEQLTPLDIKPELDREAFEELIGPLRRGERDMIGFETVHRRKDGSDYPVEVKLQLAVNENPPVFVAILQDITKRRDTAARIEKLAFYDSLTGLPNRAMCMDRLETALARADDQGRPLTLFFLDIDRFKEINDTRGHATGDRVLVEVADRFLGVLRESETLGRIGGDEFVVIAEDADREDAVSIAERLQEVMCRPVNVGPEAYTLGVSIGISFYPANGRTPEELLKYADIAMYQAKYKGGGYRFYLSRMGAELQHNLDVARRLEKALETEALELYYQPQFDLRSGRLCGAEALLRWQDVEWGWMSPAEFIPIACERHMMIPLGEWVMDQAFRQVRDWLASGLRLEARIAINIDTQQLEDGGFVARIRKQLDAHGVEAAMFQLELTESGMMSDPDRAMSVMSELHEMGLEVAVDDFGTGYSSLSYLKRFAVDKLKIDISFIRDMLENQNDLAIVSATIAMARSLGLKTIAEGVETLPQAATLLELGCDEAQGYHFGRPRPARAFAREWLDTPGRHPGAPSVTRTSAPMLEQHRRSA